MAKKAKLTIPPPPYTAALLKFVAGAKLWRLACDDVGLDDVLSRLAESGVLTYEPGTDELVDFLILECFNSMRRHVSNYIIQRAAGGEISLEGDRSFRLPPEEVEAVRANNRQISIARALAGRASFRVSVPGLGFVAPNKIDRDTVRLVETHAARLTKSAESYSRWAFALRSLFESFPDAKVLSDIPDWAAEMGRNETLRSALATVAA